MSLRSRKRSDEHPRHRRALAHQHSPIRLSIVNGSFNTMATGIVTTFVPLYMMDGLHASNQTVALLNSLPALTGLLASILGALWVPRLLTYKSFSVVALFLTRLTYVLLALVPVLGPWANARGVVEITSLGNFPQTLDNLSWQALMAKIIPSSLRESFFGQRNMMMTVVGLAATIVTGACQSPAS